MGSRTIQTPTRTGWPSCRSTFGCFLCCSVSCAWSMTNAVRTVLEWTRYLQRWDHGVCGAFTNTICPYWSRCPTRMYILNLDLCANVHVSVYLHGTRLSWKDAVMRYIWAKLTPGFCPVLFPVRRAEPQMFEVHCRTFFKNSALFVLMHNKINERSGSGSGSGSGDGDGFMGEINTLTQFSQCRT